jgi:rod shape-determining protein MreB
MAGLDFLAKDIGIDLGTANTLISIKGKGIILDEPSVVAVNRYTRKVIVVGAEAKEMIGRTPNEIEVIRPLRDGVISDFDMTQVMLIEFMKKALLQKSFASRMRIVVGVPSGVTEVEKKAVEEVAYQIGAKPVYILDEPMAAAIGSGIAVDEPKGNMIVDIGGGTTDIAVISLGGIVNKTSLRIAGDEMDEAIIAYIRKKYAILIGDKSAEELKKKIGCVFVENEEDGRITQEVRGRDLAGGLPKTITVTAFEMMKALEECISTIVDGIKSTLEEAPPELAADIIDSGIYVVGGGALLKGMDKLLERETDIKVIISDDPLRSVALGASSSLNNVTTLEQYAKKNRRF